MGQVLVQISQRVLYTVPKNSFKLEFKPHFILVLSQESQVT